MTSHHSVLSSHEDPSCDETNCAEIAEDVNCLISETHHGEEGRDEQICDGLAMIEGVLL